VKNAEGVGCFLRRWGGFLGWRSLVEAAEGRDGVQVDPGSRGAHGADARHAR
jgi:hypothetical protein